MVHTIEIKPSLPLLPFISSFAYRTLSLADGAIGRPLFATTDFILSFNLTDVIFRFAQPGNSGLIRPSQAMDSRVVITGIGSQFTGIMSTEADTRIFSIYFTPTGFLRIFGIPAVHFTNRIEEDVSAFNQHLLLLQEELALLATPDAMRACSEKFLLELLCKAPVKSDDGAMHKMAAYILNQTGNCSIEAVACAANMSIKTLERKFTEQIGTSPKLFSLIVRFNRAIALKMQYPGRSWTDIAHACGYYDQMHFIKDFRLFFGTTPTHFFKHTPPLAENSNPLPC